MTSTTVSFAMTDGGAVFVTRDTSGVWLEVGYPEGERDLIDPRAVPVSVVTRLGPHVAALATVLADWGVGCGVEVPRDVVRQSQRLDRSDAGVER
jgi:hypothetical protein